MPNFKKHVGVVNRMGRNHAANGRPELVAQRNAERIAKLVEKMKGWRDG